MLRNAGCFCKSKPGNLHVSCTFTINEIVSVQDGPYLLCESNTRRYKKSASVVTEMSVLWRKVCVEFYNVSLAER